MKMLLEFDFRKATQAINYLATREGGQIGKLKLIKLAYLADRFHIRRYGRPIFNDSYLAMQYGPVGSSVKDIAELSSFLGPEERRYAARFLEKGKAENTVRTHGPADMDVFSDSEVEALQFAYDEFGRLPARTLVDLAHRYPEWKKHEDALGRGTSRLPMSYADFFEDPDQGGVDKFALDPTILEASREEFEEFAAVAQFWEWPVESRAVCLHPTLTAL